MAEFKNRDLHIVKKALAIAVLAIEQQQPGPLWSASDQSDVKGAAEPVDRGDVEPYARAAVSR
ncbi:MAG: hypothetical protein E5Y63_06225 [Mesorhizobium sp.]|uniref:hypothetical protein n=1 Tax=Mesorhizobium sp. TaxID=1871066 RepID=UPI001229AFB2|nr:hypothetical protein [Mesorhizobium sp.]TIM31608.1 MAG: hypothetical protein E5Y63_06225 [Mesorhizobium sp.]TIN95468.1 MAG: hypothetical protein E5Y06_11990 [Mesorhizobium sp.]TJU97114.1 MAG: hypothetical protein E5Y08_18580 [Mesorhizobium sp.]